MPSPFHSDSARSDTAVQCLDFLLRISVDGKIDKIFDQIGTRASYVRRTPVADEKISEESAGQSAARRHPNGYKTIVAGDRALSFAQRPSDSGDENLRDFQRV
jgi:hypothetical protein